MTFEDMITGNYKDIWDNAGLLTMSTENKQRLTTHLLLHKMCSQNLFFGDPTLDPALDTMAKRIVKNVLALLEHKQFALNTQLNLINNLDASEGSQNQSYQTNTLNYQNNDGFTPLDNVSGQQYNRVKYSDADTYQQCWQIVELELTPVYEYLTRCMMYDNEQRVTYND